MKKEVKKKIIVSAGKTNETTIIYNSSRSAKGEKIRYFLEKLARSMGLLILNLEIILINSPPPLPQSAKEGIVMTRFLY